MQKEASHRYETASFFVFHLFVNLQTTFSNPRVISQEEALMKEDPVLVKNVLRNRSKAVERLYDRYAPSLLSLCYRYAGNLQDAEDILHEGFIKIIKSLPGFQPEHEGSLEAWMKRIMTNTALNFLRDHAKEMKNLEIDRVPESRVPVDDEPQELSLAHLPISQDQILQLIGELPAGYRAVFNLYVFEEYSHKEIGEKLNCSESTSKSQLSKARALLRAKIFETVNIYTIR